MALYAVGLQSLREDSEANNPNQCDKGPAGGGLETSLKEAGRLQIVEFNVGFKRAMKSCFFKVGSRHLWFRGLPLVRSVEKELGGEC